MCVQYVAGTFVRHMQLCWVDISDWRAVIYPSHLLSFPQASFQSSCNSMINAAIILYIIRAGIRDINPVMNVLVHQINFKAGNSPSCAQRGMVLWSCLLTFAWDFYQLNVCRALSVMMPGLCLLSASRPDRTRLSQTNFTISSDWKFVSNHLSNEFMNSLVQTWMFNYIYVLKRFTSKFE